MSSGQNRNESNKATKGADATPSKLHPAILAAAGIGLVAVGAIAGVMLGGRGGGAGGNIANSDGTGAQPDETPNAPVSAMDATGTDQPMARGGAGLIVGTDATDNNLQNGQPAAAIAAVDGQAERSNSSLHISAAEMQQINREFADQLSRQEDELSGRASTLISMVSDSARYADELGRLAKSFPSVEASSEFRRVSIEQPLWTGVQQWSDLMIRLGQTHFSGLTPEQAREALQTGDRLRDVAVISPYAEAYETLRPDLKSIASRIDLAGQRIDQRLVAFLAEEIISQVDMIEDRQGQRYYLRKGGIKRKSPTSVTFAHIISFQLDTKHQNIKPTEAVYFGPAPHCRLAVKLRETLTSNESILSEDWEVVFCDAIRSIAADKDSNPLVRLDLLDKVLQVAMKGSGPISQAFDEHADALRRAAVVDRTANWFWPASDSDRSALALAEETLARLPDTAAACDRALSLMEQRHQRTHADPVDWIGNLGLSADSSWTFLGAQPPDGDGALQVVYRDVNLKAMMTTVAEVRAGRVQWINDNPSAFLAGRPLFYVRKQGD